MSTANGKRISIFKRSEENNVQLKPLKEVKKNVVKAAKINDTKSVRPAFVPPHLMGRDLSNPDADLLSSGKRIPKPRPGVKVPCRNLTSQIVTHEEIAREILERSMRKNTKPDTSSQDNLLSVILNLRLSNNVDSFDEKPSKKIVDIRSDKASNKSKSLNDSPDVIGVYLKEYKKSQGSEVSHLLNGNTTTDDVKIKPEIDTTKSFNSVNESSFFAQLFGNLNSDVSENSPIRPLLSSEQLMNYVKQSKPKRDRDSERILALKQLQEFDKETRTPKPLTNVNKPNKIKKNSGAHGNKTNNNDLTARNKQNKSALMLNSHSVPTPKKITEVPEVLSAIDEYIKSYANKRKFEADNSLTDQPKRKKLKERPNTVTVERKKHETETRHPQKSISKDSTRTRSVVQRSRDEDSQAQNDQDTNAKVVERHHPEEKNTKQETTSETNRVEDSNTDYELNGASGSIKLEKFEESSSNTNNEIDDNHQPEKCVTENCEISLSKNRETENCDSAESNEQKLSAAAEPSVEEIAHESEPTVDQSKPNMKEEDTETYSTNTSNTRDSPEKVNLKFGDENVEPIISSSITTDSLPIEHQETSENFATCGSIDIKIEKLENDLEENEKSDENNELIIEQQIIDGNKEPDQFCDSRSKAEIKTAASSVDNLAKNESSQTVNEVDLTSPKIPINNAESVKPSEPSTELEQGNKPTKSSESKVESSNGTNKPDSKNNSKVKVMREINKLLADEGTINMIYSLGQKRSTGNNKALTYLASAKRKKKELMLKTKLVKDAVLKMTMLAAGESLSNRNRGKSPERQPNIETESTCSHPAPENNAAPEPPPSSSSSASASLTFEEMKKILRRSVDNALSNSDESSSHSIDLSKSSINKKSNSKCTELKTTLLPIRSSRRLNGDAIKGSHTVQTSKTVESKDATLKEIAIRKHDNLVQVVLLSSPSRLQNSLSAELLRELTTVLRNLADDDDCRIVLITSTGSSFCQGIDLQALVRADKTERTKIVTEYVNALTEFTKCLAQFQKLLIAGVHGSAVGLGVTMLPYFDMIYASDKATFYTPYVKLGQIPEAGSTLILPLLLGNAATSELLFGCRKLTASEALQFGLVTRILWPDKFSKDLLSLVKGITSHSAQSIDATKKLLRKTMMSKIEEQLDTEAEILKKHWCSDECQTRFRSYLQEEALLDTEDSL